MKKTELDRLLKRLPEVKIQLEEVRKKILRDIDDDRYQVGVRVTRTVTPPTKTSVGIVSWSVGHSTEHPPLDTQHEIYRYRELEREYERIRVRLGSKSEADPLPSFTIISEVTQDTPGSPIRVVRSLSLQNRPVELSADTRAKIPPGRPKVPLVQKFKEVILHCKEKQLHDINEVTRLLDSNQDLKEYLAKFKVAPSIRTSFTHLLQFSRPRKTLINRIRSHWRGFSPKAPKTSG